MERGCPDDSKKGPFLWEVCEPSNSWLKLINFIKNYAWPFCHFYENNDLNNHKKLSRKSMWQNFKFKILRWPNSLFFRPLRPTAWLFYYSLHFQVEKWLWMKCDFENLQNFEILGKCFAYLPASQKKFKKLRVTKTKPCPCWTSGYMNLFFKPLYSGRKLHLK